MNEPSLQRRALDRLLQAYPAFDLVKVDWQGEWKQDSVTLEQPWLLVTLGQRSSDGAEIWARHRFAIWKQTGAIHGLQLDGSVTDDPLLTVE